MTNKERILSYLQSIAPRGATNSQIAQATGVRPHQQVYQLTKQLAQEGLIQTRQQGNVWRFFGSGQALEPVTKQSLDNTPATVPSVEKMTAQAFERLARRVMSDYFGLSLDYGQVSNVPKRFDLVSADGKIVGDAKYYTLVRGEYLPPAKFATIAEHVWLLEKTGAPQRFLVFGNEIRVPRRWLERYGHLIDGVDFFFLDDGGRLAQLDAGRLTSTDELP